jgi:peptidyl-prolyl cis-trans isomerase SurA
MPPREVLRQQVLESLIVQQVQLQRAERLGIRISDEQLNLALQQVAANNGVSFSELPRAWRPTAWITRCSASNCARNW